MTAPLVKANGAAIPALGLGTWEATDDACISAVQWAIEAGYRHIDTAARYGNEEAVGQGIRASGIGRDALFVTTKVWYENLSESDVMRSAEASLRRLGLDTVDLLLIHWPNANIPLKETIKALGRAKRDGLTRHIGVSNFPVALLDEAVARSDEPLVANQCEYHPYLDQSKVIDACRRHGLAFTAYCPLGRGQLLDERAVIEIAERHGKTPAQVVLRWHVQQPGVVAIPKSANRERIAQNIDIFDFALDEDEMARISGLARPDGRMIDPSWAPAWDKVA